MKSEIRSMIRNTILDVLGLLTKPSAGIHLLNSHLLTMRKELNSEFFDNQLKELSKKSTIIPFEEAVELISCQKQVKHSLIAFSYDDGLSECYSNIAPVLEKYNGYGCFFINPHFIDGDKKYIASFLKNRVHLPPYKAPMKWKQIIELQKRGHVIGAHTMDHVRISDINDENELQFQIGGCKRVIEKVVGHKCNYFAFTYGYTERDFNIRSVEIAEQYYKYIFSASNWKKYYSYNRRVFNRRHCEPYWKAKHINYFLSAKVTY